MRSRLPGPAVTGLLVLACTSAAASAQRTQPRTNAVLINQTDDPLLRAFGWRAIGPVGSGGRVDDIAVDENHPLTFYIGYATGGVWKTTNDGTTFTPIFDVYGSESIGAVAVAQTQPDIVWVGTGEGNSRNNSGFGDGVYKSTDGGRTFTNMGLRESQNIQRIVIDPRNPDVVYVAALGHLYGPNDQRGLYKTVDGGRTWNRVLWVDENTGASDIALDPSNPDVIYASTYQRRRAAWGYNGGGPGSGLWKSEDGGTHWTRLTGHGLPGGTMGRIGIAVAPSNPNVVYAQIEVLRDEDRIADASKATHTTKAEKGTDNAGGVWRSTDKGATWEFRSAHNVRPQYYSVLRVDPTNENVVYTTGRSFYRSEDGGTTFRIVRGEGHGDYHAIWIDPHDHNHILVGNDGGSDESFDRGASWESIRPGPTGQISDLSVDMQRPYYVYVGMQDTGNWGGPSATRGDFISTYDWFSIGGGDGSATASDPTGHRYLFSEAQRGAMQRLEYATGRIVRIQPHLASSDNTSTNIVPAPGKIDPLRWNWAAPMIVSHASADVLYAGGNRLFKSTDRGTTWRMSPDLTKQIDPATLTLMGVPYSAPYCHGTGARIAVGETCILSKSDGTWFYSTIYTISESPLANGPLWVGTDDGNVQVSPHGDLSTWTNVTANLTGAPQNCYVSRVEASHFEAATAYVALNCHRNDDMRPYVYVTHDLGHSWQAIANDLPASDCVNVVREDPRNRNLLYAGTEFGFYVSLDAGAHWQRFMSGLPNVRVQEIVVQPRDNDIVIGTYGRSAYVMDDVTALQQLTATVRSEDVHLFAPREAILWNRDARLDRALVGTKVFRGSNPAPGTAIHYYLKQAAESPVRLTISNAITGHVFRHLEGAGLAGLNRVQWDLRGDLVPGKQAASDDEEFESRRPPRGPLATPGRYRVTLSVGGRTYAQTVNVQTDVWGPSAR